MGILSVMGRISYCVVRRCRLPMAGCLSVLGDGDVGQPILAAAAFRGGSGLDYKNRPCCCKGEASPTNKRPPEKAAAARIGCPTSPPPKLTSTRACKAGLKEID